MAVDERVEPRSRSALDRELREWVAAAVPRAWFVGAPRVSHDDVEVLIVGRLPAPRTRDASERRAECAVRIATFRRQTRALRIVLGADGARRFGRRVSWGAVCGDVRQDFSGLGVPVMTRLRLPERAVLDTLVDAGVARSRSDALAWCVRLVGANEKEWLGELRAVVDDVRAVRDAGPRSVRRRRRTA